MVRTNTTLSTPAGLREMCKIFSRRVKLLSNKVRQLHKTQNILHPNPVKLSTESKHKSLRSKFLMMCCGLCLMTCLLWE